LIIKQLFFVSFAYFCEAHESHVGAKLKEIDMVLTLIQMALCIQHHAKGRMG
jgi:hypothetical protein